MFVLKTHGLRSVASNGVPLLTALLALLVSFSAPWIWRC